MPRSSTKRRAWNSHAEKKKEFCVWCNVSQNPEAWRRSTQASHYGLTEKRAVFLSESVVLITPQQPLLARQQSVPPFLSFLFLTFQHFASFFEGRQTEKERYKTYKQKRKIVLVWRPICSNTQRRRSFPARALAPIAFSPQLHKQAHSFQTQRTVTMVHGTFFFCAERTRFSLYLYPFGVRWNARKKEKLHTYVSECVIEKTVLRWQGTPCKRETEPLPVHFLSFFFSLCFVFIHHIFLHSLALGVGGGWVRVSPCVFP